MNILILSRGIPTDRNPQWGCFEKDQAEALAAKNHKVIVASVDGRFELKRGKWGLHHFESINGVEYYNYIIPPGILFSKIFGEENYRKKIRTKYFEKILKKIIAKSGKPDIIYSHFFQNTINGKILKEKMNIPLVAIEHLARFNEEKLDNFSYNGAKYAYKDIDNIITVSASLGKSLQRWFHIPGYTVIHNLYGKEFGYLRSKNSESGKFIFISTASLVYRKGFDLLIKALSIANIPRDKWILNIIGWGEEKEKLEKLIKDLDLQDNVFLLGKKNKKEVAEQLAKSHVFVLPSRNENFSVSVLEALSMGLPVVATDCGGIRDCINKENGIIVPVDDEKALASALEQVYDNYSRYQRVAIHEYAKAHYSPEAIATQLTLLFEQTISEYKTRK